MIIILHQLFLYNKNVYSIIHRPCCTLSLLEEKACTEREVGGGSEPALSARTCRGFAPKTSSRAALASPLHPPFAERLPEIKIPIPRFARILKGLVVNICLSHHRGFIIGERMYSSPLQKVGRGNTSAPGSLSA